MGSPRVEGTLVQEDDVRKLLSVFASSVYDSATNDPEKAPVFAEIQQMCVLLFAKDYVVNVIENKQGSLSSTYPGRIVSLALRSDGVGDDTAESREAHGQRTERLRGHMVKASWARARTRFAVPVILYDGKHICRSATLSGGLEMHMRAMVRLVGESGGYIVDVCRSLVAGIWADKQDPNPEGSEQEQSSDTTDDTGPAATTEAVRTEDAEDSPEKDDPAANEAAASLHGQLRREDILLLKELSVGQICDLMVEGKKAKYNINVTSSEKVDKWNRYQGFTIFKLPYPGCEFFEKYKSEEYNAEGLVFDWDQHFIDVQLSVPEDNTASELGIDWTMYKEWDLVQLTKNYLRYLLKVVFQSTSGLLVHCISGWDRTPLFISLLRLSLWADGEIHKDLSPVEMAYLTVAYDWFLFCHNLPNRIHKSEEIFFFCFNMLKYIDTEEFSIISMKPDKNMDMDTSENVNGTCLAEASRMDAEEMQDDGIPRCSTALGNLDPDGPPKFFPIPSSSDEDASRSPTLSSPLNVTESPKKSGGAAAITAPSLTITVVEDVSLPPSEASSAPKSPLSLPTPTRDSSGASTVSGGSWQHVNETGSVVGSTRDLECNQSPKKRRIGGNADESTGTMDRTLRSTEFLQRRHERLSEVRRIVSSAYQCIMAEKINEAHRGSYWATSLFSAATSLLWQGGATAPKK